MKRAKYSKKRRIWLGLAALAVAWLAVAMIVFASWTEFETANQTLAEQAFESSLNLCADRRAYLVGESGGSFVVNRELEGSELQDLNTLHLMYWQADEKRLTRMNFPIWFVRVKTTHSINLGTYTSLLAGDWAHFELSVTVQDLQRRGPGLILDHQLAEQDRLLLWTD
jgi:hypothetical protein